MDALNPAALVLLADRFKTLSSPTRLAILQHICTEEHTVSDLCRATGLKQANVSRQLGLLRDAGLVRRRVSGNNAWYVVCDPTLPQLCEMMRESLMARQDELSASLSPPR
jgi:DNA-binding transcriptional ArsR family regulator